MKAEELRIGNLLLNPYSQQAEVVTSIRPSQALNTNFEVNEDHPDFLKPIPLNKEMLKKFGFRRGGFDGKYSDSFYEIGVGASGLFINPDNGIVWIERNENIFNVPTLIEYVHQLQNLYFSLTGSELTIKEEKTV